MFAGDEALSILSNAGHVSPVNDSLGASWANAGTAKKGILPGASLPRKSDYYQCDIFQK